MLFGRRRWDPQPTSPAAVLLASSGAPFSRAAVRRAYELAAGEPVAVLTILKVYGSQFGLPNPGLLPTRRERDEQLAIVGRAIKDLERLGGDADGQVARTRQVRYVVMDTPTTTGVRRIIEGEITNIVRRRLQSGTTLELVSPKL